MRHLPFLRDTAPNLAPGVALSAAGAGAAGVVAPLVGKAGFPVPAMVVALLIGIAFSRIAERLVFQPGISFCVKVVLRWAVALLGLRIALGEILALGGQVAFLIVVAMLATLVSGFLYAR